MADTRKPWIKWYTRDWRANAKLRMCGFAARGLWADMLTLMAEAKHFGFLLVEGIAPSPKQLVGLIGGDEREITKLLAELGNNNVYSVTGEEMPDAVKALVPDNMPPGVILSRKMLRDKAKAEKAKANGGKGGNPTLRTPDNREVNPPSNPQIPEAREEAPNGLPPEELQTSIPVAAREPEGAPHDAVPVIAALASKTRGDDGLDIPAHLRRTA